VTVTDGLFNVLLGGVTPIAELPDGPECIHFASFQMSEDFDLPRLTSFGE
jgi:hypothetical protein